MQIKQILPFPVCGKCLDLLKFLDLDLDKGGGFGLNSVDLFLCSDLFSKPSATTSCFRLVLMSIIPLHSLL